MKRYLITAALILCASAASATTPDCKKSGGGYTCQIGGNTYTAYNATSEAEAQAIALAKAEQAQEQSQGQGQSSENNNSNVNGGNSVSIAGDPAHTTNLSAGISVNVSLPLAQGYQMKNAIDAANWFYDRGDACTAFHIMADAPRVRRLKIRFNCGDKG